MNAGVSFLLPVRDGARHLAAVLAGVDRQRGLAIAIWTRRLTRRLARPGESMGGRLYSSHPPEDR